MGRLDEYHQRFRFIDPDAVRALVEDDSSFSSEKPLSRRIGPGRPRNIKAGDLKSGMVLYDGGFEGTISGTEVRDSADGPRIWVFTKEKNTHVYGLDQKVAVKEATSLIRPFGRRIDYV